MKSQYIKAVLEMFKEGNDSKVIIEGLKKTLEKRGHKKLFESILRGVLRVIETRYIDNVVVTVASKTAYEKQKKAIAEALKNFGDEKDIRLRIDENIIGGFIIDDNNQRFDHSYKNKLLNLYRLITS